MNKKELFTLAVLLLFSLTVFLFLTYVVFKGVDSFILSRTSIVLAGLGIGIIILIKRYGDE